MHVLNREIALANIESGLRRDTAVNLKAAVHRNKTLSRAGVLERMFTLAFRNLVYPQIWEDPVVDMEALAIGPDDHVVAIASGGCNVMSYLTAGPARITALDLNGAHIALNKMKLAAAKHLPGHDSFFDLFGRADRKSNVALYEQHIRPHLDPASRRYWESRGPGGRRRISMFARGFYRYGLLGKFIGAAHLVARINGCDPRKILAAASQEDQRRIFDEHFAPVFDTRLVKFLVRQPASLYGLGIPPAQYKALAGDHEDGMRAVLKARLEKLVCGFDLHDNYFAWQAFGRSYEPVNRPSVPPYLEEENFEKVRANAERVDVRHQSMTVFLKASDAASADCYVLLDAQDWMNDADLTELWQEITRTARPGARVIFRTAADERLLPGRVPQDILDGWSYDEARSRELGARDRSSIYGAFHIYTRKDAA